MCIPFPEPREFEKDLRFTYTLTYTHFTLTFRDFRRRCTMILKTLKQVKTAERNSTMSECIFHKLAVKNLIVNVVKTIYCQHNSIFLAKK